MVLPSDHATAAEQGMLPVRCCRCCAQQLTPKRQTGCVAALRTARMQPEQRVCFTADSAMVSMPTEMSGASCEASGAAS